MVFNFFLLFHWIKQHAKAIVFSTSVLLKVISEKSKSFCIKYIENAYLWRKEVIISF